MSTEPVFTFRSSTSVFGTLAFVGLYGNLRKLCTGSDTHNRLSFLFMSVNWKGASVKVSRDSIDDPVTILLGVSETVCEAYLAQRVAQVQAGEGFAFDADRVVSLKVEDNKTFDWVIAEFAELKRVCDSI